MTDRKWTKAAVLGDARRYSSKTDWSRAGSAYVTAHRNGWLAQACAHMVARWEPTWNRAAALASACDYSSRSKWKAAKPGAYKAAVRFGCLDEACAHMAIRHRTWTTEKLKRSAAPFDAPAAWKDADQGAYKAAREHGVLAQVCAHMTRVYKPAGWWTKARVIASSRKFHSFAAWDASETSARQVAQRNGWMDEATRHMESVPMPVGPATIHEFLTSHGVPYKAEHRFREDPGVARMPFDFFLPSRRLLIEYHGRQHAEGWSRESGSRDEIQRRDDIKSHWAATSGYTLLAILAWRTKTPRAIRQLLAETLGVSAGLPRPLSAKEQKRIRSGVAWTIKDVLADARTFQTRSAWMRGSSSAYRFAIRHGFAERATAHMSYLIEHGKWTKEAVLLSASKFITAAAWRKANPSVYVIATRNSWKDLACAHMQVTKRPNGYWTRERVLAAAQRFKTVGEWRREDPASYSAAKRDQLVPSGMARELVHGQWTKERISTVAKKCKTRGELRKGYPSAYTIAASKGWLKNVCGHMDP